MVWLSTACVRAMLSASYACNKQWWRQILGESHPRWPQWPASHTAVVGCIHMSYCADDAASACKYHMQEVQWVQWVHSSIESKRWQQQAWLYAECVLTTKNMAWLSSRPLLRFIPKIPAIEPIIATANVAAVNTSSICTYQTSLIHMLSIQEKQRLHRNTFCHDHRHHLRGSADYAGCLTLY